VRTILAFSSSTQTHTILPPGLFAQKTKDDAALLSRQSVFVCLDLPDCHGSLDSPVRRLPAAVKLVIEHENRPPVTVGTTICRWAY